MTEQVVVFKPNEGPQTAFLSSNAREVLYGGAVNSGKSQALVALPLRFVDHPLHRAILLRRTRPQLQETIDRTLDIYPKIYPGAQWRENEGRWKFPSGSIIQMGHAEHEKDIYQYQTFEYNLICFDELTSFTEPMYSFMMLRNRSKARDLPLWIRAGTNPGDIGHQWVYDRFIKDRQGYRIYDEELMVRGTKVKLSRQYIPASVWDNPSMSPEQRDIYVAGIKSSMSAEDAAAYLDGDWTKLAGAMFKLPLIELNQPQMLSTNYYIIRAIDYGWDDHTCVLWGIVYRDSGIIDIVSELYVRETTLDGIAHYIKEREQQLNLGHVLFSVGSPEMGNMQATSGQSISQMLTAKGIHVERADSGPGRRKAGWARIQDLLGRKALRVWPIDNRGHGAPNLLRTLPKLQRNSGLNKDPDEIRPRQEDHCLVAGTKVLTNRGQVAIENVTIRDLVLTRMGWKRVISSRQTGWHVPVWRLDTPNRTLIATPNHEIWTQNRGFVPLDKLRYSDILLGCQNENQNQSSLMELPSDDTQDQESGRLSGTMDLVLDGAQEVSAGYTKKFGKQLMGLFRLSIIFTTKIRTHLTTLWRTWSVLLQRNTPQDTQGKQTLSIWQRFVRWLRNGIVAQQADFGIVAMVNRYGPIASRGWFPAGVAANDLMISATTQNIVPTLVNPPLDELAKLTTLPEFAVFVEPDFQSINILQQKPVPDPVPIVLSVKPGGNADVYNLTVEDQPEFFANGILVHNCADSLRYLALAAQENPAATQPQLNPERKDPHKYDQKFDKIIDSISKQQKGLGGIDFLGELQW